MGSANADGTYRAMENVLLSAYTTARHCGRKLRDDLCNVCPQAVRASGQLLAPALHFIE